MISNFKAHFGESFFLSKIKNQCNIISIFKIKKNIKRDNMKNYLIQINNNSVEFKNKSKLPQDDFNQANFGLVEYTDKKDEN